MRPPTTPVELTFPCDDRWMRLARLAAGGVAAACGLPSDEAEDFRLVVHEICATLVEAGDGGPVHVGFRIDGGSLLVEGSTSSRVPEEDDARGTLGRQILGVLADSSTSTRDGDRLTLLASVALGRRGIG